MMEQEFFCTRDGLTICGTEYRDEPIPETRNHYPAVIISHGFGGNQYDLISYAAELVKLGYAVYCFDFCGGCVAGKSDGDSLDMTIDTEVADLQTVLDYVKGLSYIDQSRISLIGASQGGYVSGIVAARRPGEIERLLLFYPALCIPDDARKGTLGGANYEPDRVPDVIDTFAVRISKKFHDAVVDKDSIAQICGYQGPVLLIHGSRDALVNNQYAKRASEAYANCQLHILAGAGHGFTPEERDQAVVWLKEFF